MSILLEFLVTLWLVSKSIVKSLVFIFTGQPNKSVQGEVVLITGSGSGLGRLLCIEFAKRGSTIVAVDINESGNEETGSLIRNKGGDIHTYVCDISERDAVFKFAEKIKQDVGQIDILVNNAGMVVGKNFLDLPDDLMKKTVDVNLLAHFWTVKCFLPPMLERKHGHIVTIASVAGVIGCNGLTDYCASKFGCMGFAESLEYELAAAKVSGVHTTTVCPYFINTGMFDGCKTRFPSLLPVLEPKETVDRIMQAILTNQKIVYIPRIMYFLAFLKTILPVDAGLALHKFFGAADFMTTFKGRAKRD